MRIQEIITYLEGIAPTALQEDYDNSGLQVGDKKTEVSKVLLCLDITFDVLKEASLKGCGLVISHHPVLFKGLKRITPSDPVGEMLMYAIQNGIAIYSIHTNLDNVGQGVNKALGMKLGLDDLKILEPMHGTLSKLVTFCPESHASKVRESLFEAGCGRIGHYDSCSFNLEGIGTFRAMEGANPFVGEKGELHQEKEMRIECIFPTFLQPEVVSALLKAHPYEEVAFDLYELKNTDPYHGAGMIGKLNAGMNVMDFLEHLKRSLGLKVIRHNPMDEIEITKVAICGGSGSFLIRTAMNAGAHAFVTSDIKYHQFQEPYSKMLLCDVGHHESEWHAIPHLAALLAEKFPNFAILISETDTNPVKTFI